MQAEGRVVHNHRVSDRTRDIRRTRVGTPHGARRSRDDVLVLRTRVAEVDVGRPVAIAFTHERMARGVPVVEGARDADRGCIRRPNAKRRSGGRTEIRVRANAWSRGLREDVGRREQRSRKPSKQQRGDRHGAKGSVNRHGVLTLAFVA